jgi:prepilin-type N-terminal cleavage/methylation domain-containing protein
MDRVKTRGLTLLEVVVSSAIFVVILSMVAGLLSSTASATSLVNSVTTAQTEAERVVAFLREELRGARTEDMAPLGAAGGETATEISYVTVDSSAPLFDSATPGQGPWAGERRILRFEADGDEILGDDIDNDGDFLVDEGRLALYVEVSGVRQLLAVVAHDLGSDGRGGDAPLLFTVDSSSQSLPTLVADVHVERILTEAVKGQDDLDALRAGSGPRVSHTSRLFVTLLN